VKLLRRFSIVLAALAVLVMSTAYAAHRHKQDLANEGTAAEHCELCLQVGRGTGPVAVEPTLVAEAVGWILVLAVAYRPLRLPQPLRRYNPARAPPR
jgi:hypothetical protein